MLSKYVAKSWSAIFMYFTDFKIDTRKWNLRKDFPKCISFAVLRVSNKGEKW